ncbi:uncharacterized protein BCR38DRAFT_419629, partial [Pseudomassariella vexata]
SAILAWQSSFIALIYLIYSYRVTPMGSRINHPQRWCHSSSSLYRMMPSLPRCWLPIPLPLPRWQRRLGGGGPRSGSIGWGTRENIFDIREVGNSIIIALYDSRLRKATIRGDELGVLSTRTSYSGAVSEGALEFVFKPL